MSQGDVVRNLQHCPRFERCNRNLCPLDLELHLRYEGGECRWMQEQAAKPRIIAGKSFIVGGAIMPDEILRYVPKENVERLNFPSRRRWHELRAPEPPETDPRSAENPGNAQSDLADDPQNGIANFEGHRVEEPQRVKATGVTKQIQTAEAVEGSNSCVSDCGSTRSLVVGGCGAPPGQKVGVA